jgi:septation ring formation regulator EzrA
MGNEEQRERVMSWANMMQDRPHSSAHEHLPNYADFSAVLLAQEAEIDQLKKQLSEKHTSDVAAGWSEADAHYGRIEEERNELRESEARCREALKSAEHTARKQRTLLVETVRRLETDHIHYLFVRAIRAHLDGSMPREADERIAQLQRDLDAAYAALRDVMDDLGDSLDWMEQDHAEALKKARDGG